jgi:hypothetical protein
MKTIVNIKLAAAALSFFILAPALAQQEKMDTIKREKRIVIIKKTHDSLDTEDRDTIEVHWNDNEWDSMPEGRLQKGIPGIISSGNVNIGFANIHRPNADVLGVLKPYTAFPELKNGNSMHIALENNWGFNLVKGKLRLWLGLRYDILNFRFNDADVRLASREPYFRASMDSMSNSTKSKVVVNYLGVPIALGFQSNPNQVEEGFFIRAGANAGYRVRTHTKVKLENGNKEKAFDDFNFNDFSISPFVYIGYNSIGLYARYTTTPLFKENQGEEAYAFQFGLILQ